VHPEIPEMPCPIEIVGPRRGRSARLRAASRAVSRAAARYTMRIRPPWRKATAGFAPRDGCGCIPLKFIGNKSLRETGLVHTFSGHPAMFDLTIKNRRRLRELTIWLQKPGPV